MLWIALCALMVLGSWTSQVQAQGPVVILPGTATRLTGIYMPYNESEYLNVDTTFQAFLGIPYAEPPVGGLRFKNPAKKELGRAYLAIADRPQCPQVSPIDEIPVGRDVSEDCLYLGVHTSSPRPSSAPVVVWFHGGGYTIGSGSTIIYEPLPIIAASPDIIFVTVNYRLGVYGYLTTGDSVSPGNYGMYDQVMALEWVRDNIAAFGGDPNRVTIMGESAGAASVGLHLVSPFSEGLFGQAIMQSGNALCPWAVDTNISRQVGFTMEIADLVNCTDKGSEALVGCLRGVDEQDLTRAQITLTLDYLKNELLFTPVVDEAFLPDLPATLISRGDFHSVPTLMGTNEDEGTLIALREYPSYVVRQKPPTITLEEFRELVPQYIYYSSPMLAKSVEQWYVDWTQADNSSANQVNAFIRMNTDEMFACPTEAMSRAMIGTGAPVYRYEMTHDPSTSIFLGLPKWMGAGHAEELQFVFAWGLNPDVPEILKRQTDEEKVMSVQIMRYWTNFIKTGDPNGLQPAGDYPSWPRYSLPELNYKKLSLDMDNGRAPRMDTCAFWLNYAPDVYNYGTSGDQYDDWQRDYIEWRDVHLPAWMEVFEEYKKNDTCAML